MIRGPLPVASLLFVTLWGCVEHAAPRFETASKLPDDEPRAAGVAVDFAAAARDGHHRGDTSSQVVALHTPLDEAAALVTVRRFFEVVAREDIYGMGALLDTGARLHNLNAHQGRSARFVTTVWQRRFSQHNYGQLPAQQVYPEWAVASYRSVQRRRLPAAVRHALPFDDARALVLRVPISTTGVHHERLFGDELFFLLRPIAGHYLITAIAEAIPH